MKNEQHIDNTQFDTFEAPANLWERIENGLDEKKNKRRAIIWWRIAAGIALLGGLGFALSLMQGNNIVSNNKLTSEVKLPVIKKDSVNETSKDTVHLAEDDKELELKKSLPINVGAEFKFDPNQINLAMPSATVQAPTLDYNTYMWTSPNTNVTTITNGTYTLNATGASTTNLSYASPTSLSMFRTTTTTSNSQNTQQGIISGSTNSNRVTPTTGKVNEVDKRFRGDISGEGFDKSSNSSYENLQENIFKPTSKDPLSTFSIDVDGASYSDVRGAINRNTLPNPDAVRLEEFINYFPYEYPEPRGEHPFSVNTELAACPWNPTHQLLKVGIKGESIEKAQLPTNNLVFLLDVSGSMASAEKLELLKKGFRMLVNELREEDRVAIVVYAGAAGLVLPPTSGTNKDQILDALNRLQAGGSTAGGQGIELAYATAQKHFDAQGNNRIILATDGDFNVGVSDNDALVRLIEEKRKSGVFLTVLGFGHDNFQSDKMEKLANNGNGNFSFIDNILEAKKVLVTEMGATLQTIAKDVKIQVEFNPKYVGSYRLLGYENRMLEHKDFANDTVDAGELGAGHTVTAVYELIPSGVIDAKDSNDGTELKYSKVDLASNGNYASELATIKFRYKEPDGTKSKLIEVTIAHTAEMNPSTDFQFVQAVIEFGLLLRKSQYAGRSSYADIIHLATNALGTDNFGYRSEFLILVEKAKMLAADPLIE